MDLGDYDFSLFEKEEKSLPKFSGSEDLLRFPSWSLQYNEEGFWWNKIQNSQHQITKEKW